MQMRESRPFQIGDALILVATAAVGMAAARAWVPPAFWRSGSPGGMLRLAPMIASILLLSLSAAVLVLRFRAPRPRHRRLWRQPGFLAVAAASFFFAWRTLHIVLHHAVGRVLPVEQFFRTSGQPHGLGDEFRMYFFQGNHPQSNVGMMVAFLWLAAWAAGRWRPEPDWIDRAGRIIGAAWIVLGLLAAGVYAA